MKKILPISTIAGLIILLGCVSPQTRRQDYVNQHQELSPEAAGAILKGEIEKGMTFDEVRASWGDPDQTTISTSGPTLTETWSYEAPVGRFKEGVVILTFTDGTLSSLVR